MLAHIITGEGLPTSDTSVSKLFPSAGESSAMTQQAFTGGAARIVIDVATGGNGSVPPGIVQ